MLRYNPAHQYAITPDNEEDCWFGKHPTLAEVRRDYGDNAPVMWLVAQLYELCEYTGVRKMSADQTEAVARVIASEFFYLKLTELMLFFKRLKAGRYGRFYGTVDTMQITTSLQDFVRERAQVYDRWERRRNAERIGLGRDKAVTWQDYLRKRGLPSDHDPLRREAGDAVQD